jgi:hypothetical protein
MISRPPAPLPPPHTHKRRAHWSDEKGACITVTKWSRTEATATCKKSSKMRVQYGAKQTRHPTPFKPTTSDMDTFIRSEYVWLT